MAVEKITTEEARNILLMMSQGYKVPKIVKDVIFKVAKTEIEDKGRVVIIKRDPNVGSRRMQGMYAKIVDGSTMEIHPAIVGGFGADFDGDTVRCRLRCTCKFEKNETGHTVNHECHIGEILSVTNAFEFYSKEEKRNGILVSKYKPKKGYTVKIKAIDIETGNVEMKNVSEYSIHEFIKLYKIEDTKDRFETIHASSDHSLIVYDDNDKQIKKISPIDLLENLNNRYLIKENNNTKSNHLNDISIQKLQEMGLELIPVSEVNIEYDPDETTGYDLTVDDFYTFATHDGLFIQDTMAVYHPISNEAQKEVKDKMISTYGIEGLNKPNFELSKEMLTGIFTLTYDENKKSQIKTIKKADEANTLPIDQRVKFNDIETTAGRVVFNSNLPKYIPFVNEPIDKKKLNGILAGILEKSIQDNATTIDKLMRIGFFYATVYPKTMSIDMMKLNPKLIKLKQKLANEEDIARQMDIQNEMESEMLKYLEKNHSDIFYMVKSGGAKGSNQIRQLMVAKGLTSDPMGNVIPAISTSISDGYSPEEYFKVSAAGRKGIIDRALNTANGGYAYRKFIFLMANVEADINIGDCDTPRTLDIKLTNELMKRMPGRYVYNNSNKIIPINEKMIGNVIKLRSPIFCRSQKICRICYGDLLKQLKSKNVGILASMTCTSLSERIMKAFHLGGAVILNRVDIINEIMDNLNDDMLQKVKSLVHQKEDDLFNDSEFATIRIDKNIYNSTIPSNRIVEEHGFIKLVVGHFTLSLDGFEINVEIEQPVKIYIPEEREDNDNIISCMYAKGDKLFRIESIREDFSKLAQNLDGLVAGKSPWSSIPGIYKKFYKQLSVVGSWDSVHLETIISNVLRAKRNPQKPARLVEPFDPDFYSIKRLPGMMSWPLGVALENFSVGLQSGLCEDRAPSSQIEKVLFGEPLY